MAAERGWGSPGALCSRPMSLDQWTTSHGWCRRAGTIGRHDEFRVLELGSVVELSNMAVGYIEGSGSTGSDPSAATRLSAL